MGYQRDFPRRLDVAVIGAGSHSYRNILPALHYLPVRLRAICDVNEDLVRRTASEYGDCHAYTSAAQMYAAEKLDAVFIAVGPQLHPQLACEAFAAGKHVWLEKPVALRAADVQMMIEQRREQIAVVGFKKVFMPAARKALEVIHSPTYGNLRSILAVYPMEVPVDGRAVLDARKFTNWLGNGVHPLSLLLAAGGAVRSVTTHRSTSRSGAVYLEFVNGVAGTFHLASGPQPIERYEFFADTWHLEIDNSRRVTLQRQTPFKYGVTTDYCGDDNSGSLVWEPQNCLATLENKALYTQGVVGEMEYFCDCVLAGTPAAEGSLEFALHLMQVYEAALTSQGQPVVIE